MSGTAGLSGWRWLFILQGIPTFALAIVSVFILPDEPLKTWWLSEEERQLAHSRVKSDTVESRTDTNIWKGLKECGKDKNLWVLVVMHHFHTASSNYKNFFPTIVGTMGFSRNVTLALTCPPYIIAGAVAIVYSWNSGRMNERTWCVQNSSFLPQLIVTDGFRTGTSLSPKEWPSWGSYSHARPSTLVRVTLPCALSLLACTLATLSSLAGLLAPVARPEKRKLSPWL